MAKKLKLAALLVSLAAGMQVNAQKTGPNPDAKSKTTLHTGNALCLLDLDGDGDFDYLDGNVSFSDLQALYNGKKDYNYHIDTMRAQDTTWQSNGKILELLTWPSAFNIDFDQDGKKDVVISPHAGVGSENYKCIVYYKNTGTASTPNFTYQGDSLLIDKLIDLGTASAPVFYDYNKDGKLDLFIGSDGYYQSNGTYKSKITYYLNTSTTGNPAFTFQTDDFLGISASNFAGATMAFGDLDNDGKDDMIIGHTDGTLSFYKNTAASNSVQPVWVLSLLKMKSVANDTIDVGSDAAPAIYDINLDGKKDLFIGNNKGTLYFYLNQGGTAGNIQLQFKTDHLANIKADPGSSFSGNSYPFFGKMDNTNKDYLLLGSTSGVLYRYDGFQLGDTIFNRVDSGYSGIKIGRRSAPAIADVDGNGTYEMVLGNDLGGLYLFEQNGPSHYVADTSVKVFAYSKQKPLAWCGGFNNPQFNIADLNKDGKNDLVIYENGTGEVKTFLNIGTAGNAEYRYHPEFQKNFPTILSFLKMVDYNRDGIMDLVYGSGVITVYKGSYNAQNQLTFSIYKELWYPDPFTPGAFVNAYVQPGDIADVVDVDNDGDLDFFAYDVFGGNMINFYRNRQVEDSLPKDSISICLQSQCWGKSYQTFDRTQILHIGPNVCAENATSCPLPTAVNTIDKDNFICDIYPNPAVDILQIRWNSMFDSIGDITITIHDITGKLIAATTVNSNKLKATVSLQEITASGIYICTVQANGAKVNKRIYVDRQ